METYDPISGNIALLHNAGSIPIEYRSGYATVEVEIGRTTSLPESIRFVGKIYRIRTVFGCTYRPSLRATEFGIKIGDHRTKLWKTPLGAWYVYLNS